MIFYLLSYTTPSIVWILFSSYFISLEAKKFLNASKSNGKADSSTWPNYELKLGQVSGIGLDSKGNLHVFHRGDREWDYTTFDENNIYQKRDGPIKAHTHLVLNSDDGMVLHKFGADRFYMPHGLTVDSNDNVWLTDVALHQVFKIPPGREAPSLVLGEAFVPGKDKKHFCKPTDVAVSRNGEIFVADGYCNSRILKFKPSGEFVGEFGKPSSGNFHDHAPAGTFQIPHSVTLVEDLNLLCVADRENERIQCFSANLGHDPRSLPFGTFIRKAEKLGRVFAIDNINHYLIGVTGPSLTTSKRQLFIVDIESGESQVTEPGLVNPHDLAAAEDGTIFVAEIGPNRIVKLHI